MTDVWRDTLRYALSEAQALLKATQALERIREPAIKYPRTVSVHHVGA